MIITISNGATSDTRAQLMALLCHITGNQQPITSTLMNEREVIAIDLAIVDTHMLTMLNEQKAIKEIHIPTTSYQLASRAFQEEDTSIIIGNAHECNPVTIGGRLSTPVIMAGPCAVESREQLITTAHAVKRAGAQVLRGGAFKPRTSPYQFQGLGIEGLHMLAEARDLTGLPVITEVMEPGMVETVAEYADVLQIGTRNAQNFPLLLAAGRNSKHLPVLLKRGLSLHLMNGCSPPNTSSPPEIPTSFSANEVFVVSIPRLATSLILPVSLYSTNSPIFPLSLIPAIPLVAGNSCPSCHVPVLRPKPTDLSSKHIQIQIKHSVIANNPSHQNN